MLINDSQHTGSYPSQSAHVWAQGWSSKVTNRTPPRRRLRRRSRCRTAASRSRTTRSLLRAVPRWRQKPTNGRPTMPQPQHTMWMWTWVTDGHWWSMMVTVGGEKQTDVQWLNGHMPLVFFLSLSSECLAALLAMFCSVLLLHAATWCWARHDGVQCKPWSLAQGPFGWRQFRRWRGQGECFSLELYRARDQENWPMTTRHETGS